MIAPLGDNRIAVLHQALTGLAQRQQAIANNIANVDTPGYQRQDVSFESQLRGSTGAGPVGMSLQMAATAPGHMAATAAGDSSLLGGLFGAGSGSADGGSAKSTAVKNDGNNVDIDYEMTQLAETSLRYEMLTQATSSRFNTLHDILSKIS